MPKPVSRAEFAMLVSEVAENGRRLEASAPSVAGLSVQMTEVIKDVADVRNELASFRREHERLHERDAAARMSGRRWIVGTAIACLAALEGPLLYLVHVHG